MRDDPRLLRVLKRYPKAGDLCDATIDLSELPIEDVRAAFRAAATDRDVRPRRLDTYAIEYFSRRWPGAFDSPHCDYFMHTYTRREYANDIAELGAPSEDGPPSRVEHDPSKRWVSVKPKDGLESYEVFPKE